MAQENNIINSWSLIAFAREFGPKMFTGECINSETGESFQACSFGKNREARDKKLVHFSQNLGALSTAEIAANKDSLQVVEIVVKPEVLERRKAKGQQLESYILCSVGENSWSEVDLGL